MSLWYEQYDSTAPAIELDGMTIRSTSGTVYSTSIDYWSTELTNDIHFNIGVNSLTFDSTLSIIGCELVVVNNVTANISSDPFIVYQDDFELVSSSSLPFPERSLSRAIKSEGSFIMTYPASQAGDPMTVIDTQVCVVLQNNATGVAGAITLFGQIFHITSLFNEGVLSTDTLRGTYAGSQHIIRGSVVASND